MIDNDPPSEHIPFPSPKKLIATLRENPELAQMSPEVILDLINAIGSMYQAVGEFMISSVIVGGGDVDRGNLVLDTARDRLFASSMFLNKALGRMAGVDLEGPPDGT